VITYLIAFLLALTVSWALTLVVRNRAHAYGWLERASSGGRKIHQTAVPRLGGIAIVIGFFAPLAALLVIDSSVGTTYKASPDLIHGLFGGGVAIAALGLWDDFRGSGAGKKFTVQFAVAFGMWLLGFRIDALAGPILGGTSLGIASLPITLIWIVGVINAMNLIDGLDGLAGGIAFFAVATNFVLAFARGDILMSLVMASLAGAVLGFLAFNFNPASIFMGDTGSMFLGFVLAVSSIKCSQKSDTAVALLIPILTLGLPIMDTLLAITRRALQRRPIFRADREHIHHRLMSRLAMSHRHAVLVLYAMSCLFAVIALALAYANSAQSALLLGCVAVIVAVFMRKLDYVNLREVRRLPVVRSRNAQLRALVKTSSDRLRAVRDVSEVWAALQPLAEGLELSSFALRLDVESHGAAGGLLFQLTRQAGTALAIEARLDISAANGKLGEIQASWRDGREGLNPEEELALEVVADVIGETVSRVCRAEALGSSSRLVRTSADRPYADS
jgi:UDP-GlcNAc:undecaprenyl-phosphate/decaprenyl-phosphate GlcNAc-1-phosphate transferase